MIYKYFLADYQNRWISIAEALPAVTRCVIIATKNKRTYVAYYNKNTKMFHFGTKRNYKSKPPIKGVEYWMLKPLHPDKILSPFAWIPVYKIR